MITPVRQLARRVRVRLSRRDSGRAVVEFVFLGVLLLVPLIYLVMVIGRIQAAAFAVSTAAREAGRAFTTAQQDTDAYPRARAAAGISFEDYGFAGDSGLTLSCDGAPCLRPQGRVSAQATIEVRLPLVPDFLVGAIPTSVPVTATHVATVDRFAGR